MARLVQTLILQIRKTSSRQVKKLGCTVRRNESWEKTLTPRSGSFLIHKVQQGPFSSKPTNSTAYMQAEVSGPGPVLGDSMDQAFNKCLLKPMKSPGFPYFHQVEPEHGRCDSQAWPNQDT